ncbi:hypothetical protein [Arsenophonus nasoniae]|uniref:Lipoprotein n=1 Tax=Arsenophonus nasoniae TaxID=638 RepID=A0AA95GBA0_9GAMM|nr:hypothetical protein [Arsenophonus nasoniae]WGL93965.1 hypothetical protein QE207_01095 [Arsenophonus nasoniae]
MKIILFITFMLLVGCSSPPQPTAIDFNVKKAEIINPILPEIKRFEGLIPSKNSGHPWKYTVQRHHLMKFSSLNYQYALAHADGVIIEANSEKIFNRVKSALIKQGTVARILYQYRPSLLSIYHIHFIKKSSEGEK